jgi:hypothetical protein
MGAAAFRQGGKIPPLSAASQRYLLQPRRLLTGLPRFTLFSRRTVLIISRWMVSGCRRIRLRAIRRTQSLDVSVDLARQEILEHLCCVTT